MKSIASTSILIIVMILITTQLIFCQIPQEEYNAMVDIATTIPRLVSALNWNSTNNPCEWQGVTCSDDHVTQIILNNNQLNGSIPSSIGSLSQLEYLDLGDNQLTGSIPSSIGSLSQLEYLSIIGNQLNGSIPSSIGSLAQLEYLYLDNNQLTGSIPSSIGNLAKVQGLDLNNNQLTGSIPSSIGNLAKVQGLYLFINQLTGSIPSSIGSLAQLEYLYLNNNQLTGSIPSSIGSLAQLQHLSIFDNQLTGCLSLQNIIQIIDVGSNSLCCQDSRFNQVDLGAQTCPASLSLYVTNGSHVNLDSNYYSQLIVDNGGVITLNQSVSVGCISINNGSIEVDLSSVTTSATFNDYDLLSYQCNQTTIEDIPFSVLTSQNCSASPSNGLISSSNTTNTLSIALTLTITCVDPQTPDTSPSSSTPNNSQVSSSSATDIYCVFLLLSLLYTR